MLTKSMKYILLIYCWLAASFFVAQAQEVTLNIEQKSQYLLLPVPNKTISLDNKITVSLGNKLLPSSSQYLLLWPDQRKKQYVRLLLITFPQELFAETVKLSWQASTAKLQQASAMNASPTLAYPDKAWLSRTLLLHPGANVTADWYIRLQSKYANYVTNDKLLSKYKYPVTKPSPWLYDRVQALYQLYLFTEKRQWLRLANKYADTYQQLIDKNGFFSLKKGKDVKYLLARGLFFQYLLTGQESDIKSIERLYQASLSWQPDYSIDRGFWTERNQAAALNVALAYWEITGSNTAKQRIDSIINATVKMTFSPENDWPLRGCPQHSIQSHESRGGNYAACSPWMMALLSDGLWRYYLLTGDRKSAALLSAFGDFVLQYASYYGDKRVKNILIPKYLVVFNKKILEELNQWTDPQHMCDVATMLGKSIYIKRRNNEDDFLPTELFSVMSKQCQQEQMRTFDKYSKQEAVIAKPPRRFGWTYSSTSELPWLMTTLLKD